MSLKPVTLILAAACFIWPGFLMAQDKSESPSLMAMREFGDVIALDQRATGMSKPSLDCSISWEMPLDIPGEGEVALESIGEKIRVCLQELKRKGVDPAGYNNNENADDIGEEVSRGLPNSTHLIVEGAGHGWELFYFTPEVRTAMMAFLQGEPLGTGRAHSSITLIPVRQ